jgi:uncharacterized short protein YbdD (DUF466 family)
MAMETVRRLANSRADVAAIQSTRWRRVRRLARQLWRGIRDWCGDSAYERYLHSKQQLKGSGDGILSEEKFYVEQLQRRYSRPNRCC